jgi:thiamine biosynthesis lipoprotein
MATTFEVVVPFATPFAHERAAATFELLDDLEAQMTVYRETSEVCAINRHAFRQAVAVEPELFGLLQLAAQIHADTEGAFDVAVGALIKAWGFFRGPRRVPSPAELEAARHGSGTGLVLLDDLRRTVRFVRPGVEFNLGAIGKGYALDRLTAFLERAGKMSTVLLHGGHSSVYAKGSPDGERGWPIDLTHPANPERTLARVWLRDKALGTSAATYQYFEHEGRKFGHVLDPRTGWPAEGMASASVLAKTGALADALSTAFFVGGIDLARRYCAAHPEVGALLLPTGADARLVVLGLGSDEVSLPPDGCPPNAAR